MRSVAPDKDDDAVKMFALLDAVLCCYIFSHLFNMAEYECSGWTQEHHRIAVETTTQFHKAADCYCPVERHYKSLGTSVTLMHALA
jgi:hypothetical protein